ncbi:hypothetical protein ACFU99_13205, partial [Streptomyces sp. NPDC057654]|uniref:hypothetical protein n=1 Tax=Streptomyces sp. NPDC057654 TaxID=3346196 RepID=UPI0036769642
CGTLPMRRVSLGDDASRTARNRPTRETTMFHYETHQGRAAELRREAARQRLLKEARRRDAEDGRDEEQGQGRSRRTVRRDGSGARRAAA